MIDPMIIINNATTTMINIFVDGVNSSICVSADDVVVATTFVDDGIVVADSVVGDNVVMVLLWW